MESKSPLKRSICHAESIECSQLILVSQRSESMEYFKVIYLIPSSVVVWVCPTIA